MEEDLLVDDETLNVEEDQDSIPDEKEEKLKKLEEIARNQEIRAKKAEAKLKALEGTPKVEKETPKNPEMSLKDIRALSDVHDDDVDDIIDYAKYKGVTVAEAKKSPAMQALIKAKEEERKTAQATNTGIAKRGTSQKSDERVLEEFRQGKISEDDDAISRLAEARFNARKNRK